MRSKLGTGVLSALLLVAQTPKHGMTLDGLQNLARVGAPELSPDGQWLAGVERESLYRALSAKDNPRFSMLTAIIKIVGLKLTVEAAR